MPRALSRPIWANRRSVSRAVSEVVGSSKMTMRASAPRALAISTSWRSPWLRRDSGVPGATSSSIAAKSARARKRTLRRSMNGRPEINLGKPPMNRFSSTVRLRKRLSS